MTHTFHSLFLIHIEIPYLNANALNAESPNTDLPKALSRNTNSPNVYLPNAHSRNSDSPNGNSPNKD